MEWNRKVLTGSIQNWRGCACCTLSHSRWRVAIGWLSTAGVCAYRVDVFLVGAEVDRSLPTLHSIRTLQSQAQVTVRVACSGRRKEQDLSETSWQCPPRMESANSPRADRSPDSSVSRKGWISAGFKALGAGLSDLLDTSPALCLLP